MTKMFHPVNDFKFFTKGKFVSSRVEKLNEENGRKNACNFVYFIIRSWTDCKSTIKWPTYLSMYLVILCYPISVKVPTPNPLTLQTIPSVSWCRLRITVGKLAIPLVGVRVPTFVSSKSLWQVSLTSHLNYQLNWLNLPTRNNYWELVIMGWLLTTLRKKGRVGTYVIL